MLWDCREVCDGSYDPVGDFVLAVGLTGIVRHRARFNATPNRLRRHLMLKANAVRGPPDLTSIRRSKPVIPFVVP